MWTPSPVTSTNQNDPESQPSTSQEPVATAHTMLSSTEGIDTLQPTPTTPSVDPESQFDEHWTGTTTPYMATDAVEDTSNFPASTTLYRSRADDIFTSQQEFGRSSVIASSVVTATVSEIITEKEASTTTAGYFTPYEQFKLGLIVTLSIVIGCFAITAISLRIRSRIKKRRQELELTRKRRKNVAGNTNTKPAVKRVTIQMGRDSSSSTKRSNKRPRRGHSPSLQSRAKIPEVHSGGGMDRSRTLDALLDAGTYAPSTPLPLQLTRNRTRSDVSSRTGLVMGSKSYDVSEHAYDNPAISSAEEMTTEVSVLSEDTCPPLQMKIDADVHCSHTDALTQNASDSEDGSVEKGNFIEGSETESLGDARKRFKFNHYFGMRSNQRNDSKDSGYVESFISQDSLRLRAMASLEEGRALSEGLSFAAGQERILPRLANIEPSFFMASVDETSNLNLNRSSSIKSENDGRAHPKAYQGGNVMTMRQSRYSVPSFPTQYPQCYPRSKQVNPSLYHELYGAPYLPFKATMQRYPSSESSAYDYPSNQSDYGLTSLRSSTANRVLPKSLSYETTVFRSRDFVSPQHKPRTQDYAHQKRIKRFVKRRSLGTQTGDSDDLKTNVQPIVQWDFDGTGNLVAKPRENIGVDFIGPIYMAEELEEMGVPKAQL
ncbi:uncharacterized protein LOC110978964 isoform X2 [Acanthaster planci]|uniref:Uncharacterized protein LOC110978964 isoform X2 n=1 Tax=Acanthaster planci TaxID=133434 RepID=A0A8B7YBW8_ACAPL|nr:uncharacterized protein LOC110978964 isoform X2 [Acanthaster planci]